MSIVYPSCAKCKGLLNLRFNNNLYLDLLYEVEYDKYKEKKEQVKKMKKKK